MTELRRTLTAWDLTLLVVGNVIGSGIFIVPSTVLRQSGSVPVALGVWLVGGILSLFGAMAYAELGAMDRGSGGLYSYVRDAFGRFPAFLFGWTMFFGIGGGAVAALSVAAANYAGQFVELGPWERKAVAIGLIAGIVLVTVRGIRQSASVQNMAAVIKLGALVVMSLVLILLGQAVPAPPAAPATGASFAMLSTAGTAMISVLWAYEGWQYVTFSAGEAVNPKRSLPVAIGLGTAIIVVAYLLANVGYLAALGPTAVAASDRVASEAVTTVLGPWAGGAIAAAIILAMSSAALGIVITMPRGYYTMAREGVFFSKLAEVHPRFGTPALSIIWSCAWSAILVLSGTFDQLLAYVVFVGWIFYALGGAAVIVLRRTRPDAERPFRVPGYPLTPALFVLAAVALVLNTVFAQPKLAAVGLGMVFLGAPAYWIWRKQEAGSRRQGS